MARDRLPGPRAPPGDSLLAGVRRQRTLWAKEMIACGREQDLQAEPAATGVENAVAEDEGIGVVQTTMVRHRGPVRTPDVMGTLTTRRRREPSDACRFRLPFTSCPQGVRMAAPVAVGPLAVKLQQFPGARVILAVSLAPVPTNVVAVIGTMLTAGVRELNEATSIVHRARPPELTTPPSACRPWTTMQRASGPRCWRQTVSVRPPHCTSGPERCRETDAIHRRPFARHSG